MFSCILARESTTGGIGYENKMPWRIPEDLSHFQRLTLNSTVIVGRRTWEGLPPLKERRVIVVSSTLSTSNDVESSPSLEGALLLAQKGGGKIFVIGGAQLYRAAFQHPDLESVYLTEVVFKGDSPKMDCFFTTPILEGFLDVSEKRLETASATLMFRQYNKIRLTQELHYRDLLLRVMVEGEQRGDRTKVGTRSLFGPQIEFDLRKGFPLLTTKRVFWRGVVEELLWFLRGQTNSNTLSERGVKIWEPNADPAVMSRLGLDYPPGELGPIYGFQMRHFGAVYDPNNVSTGGFDQIADVIRQLKQSPESRRILFCNWNPCDIPKMALPPCHVLAQFYVHTDKRLDCKLYQRSADLPTGSPFNIASYALLTHMLAAMCDLTPGRLIYSLGDAHVYNNQLTGVAEQLLRPLRPLPELKVKRVPAEIELFEVEDFELVNYNPHPAIHFPMNA